MPDQKPIATYYEKSFATNRTIDLYPDHLLISGSRGAGPDGTMRLELDQLNPRPTLAWRRSPLFMVGLALFVGGVIARAVLIDQFKYTVFDVLVLAMFGVCFLGVLLMLIGWGRVEWASFPAGPTGAEFELARSGPNKHRFDDFLEQVITRIIVSQQKDSEKLTGPSSGSSSASLASAPSDGRRNW